MSLDVNLDKVKSSSSGGTIDRLRHPTISTGTSVVVKYIYKATSIGAFCLVSFFSPKDVANYVQMQFSKWTAPTQGRKQAKNQRLKHQYVSLSFPKMEQSNQRTTYVLEQPILLIFKTAPIQFYLNFSGGPGSSFRGIRSSKRRSDLGQAAGTSSSRHHGKYYI